MDILDLQDSVYSFLLADAEITMSFGERFKLTPFTNSVMGCNKGGQRLFTAYITYQIESKKSFGVATVVASQDGIQTLDILINDVSRKVNLTNSLVDDTRAFLLQDSKIRRVLGKGLTLRELTSATNASHICASFEVEGSKQSGIASITVTEKGVSQLEIFIDEESFVVELPKRATMIASSA